MPGRLVIYDDSSFRKEAKQIFPKVKNSIGNISVTYNLAPTHEVPVLLDTLNYTNAQFGLIPSWAKDDKSIHINARSESLFEKMTFREAFKKRRCLIPLNGFYEWEKKDKEKIPYYISEKNDKCFVLAGLWEEWFDIKNNKTVLSACLITTQPNDTISKIHDRMPVILQKNDWRKWLDVSTSISELNKLFVSSLDEQMKITEVSPSVNHVKNNIPECIEAFHATEEKTTDLFSFD